MQYVTCIITNKQKLTKFNSIYVLFVTVVNEKVLYTF
jgi:hypothetical protein